MKIRGSIAGTTVIVLIDSGASHNFIAERFLGQPRVQTEEANTYTVTVGDGHLVTGKLQCRDVLVNIQGLHIRQTFYLFPLRGVDVVLGIAWLQTLSEGKVNWRQLTMKIGSKGHRICLRGDPALSRIQASFKVLMRSVRKKGEGFLVECNNVEEEEKEGEMILPDIQQLLENFPRVCKVSSELPPRCAQDHAIVVKPGEQPPNIRPYRYAHA